MKTKVSGKKKEKWCRTSAGHNCVGDQWVAQSVTNRIVLAQLSPVSKQKPPLKRKPQMEHMVPAYPLFQSRNNGSMPFWAEQFYA